MRYHGDSVKKRSGLIPAIVALMAVGAILLVTLYFQAVIKRKEAEEYRRQQDGYPISKWGSDILKYDQRFENGDRIQLDLKDHSDFHPRPADVTVYYNGKSTIDMSIRKDFYTIDTRIKIYYIGMIDNYRVYRFCETSYLFFDQNGQDHWDYTDFEGEAINDTDMPSLSRHICSSHYWKYFLRCSNYLAKRNDPYIKKRVNDILRGKIDPQEIEENKMSTTVQELKAHARMLKNKYRL